MIGAILDWKERLLGRGDASITVPVFDGADPDFIQYDRRWGKAA